MREQEVRERAFAMPLTSPAFPIGPTQLTLFSHALAPLAELPVLEIVSGTHIIADLTLELGKVVHDYLA